MGTSEIEESPGVVSSMRKNLRKAVDAGIGMIVAGILLAFGMLLKEKYDLIPIAVTLISGGPALIAIGLGAKAWQSQAEKATVSVPSPSPSISVARRDGPIDPPPGA